MLSNAAWEALVTTWETYLQATGAPTTTIGLRTYHVRRLAAELGDRVTATTLTFDQLTDWLAGHTWKPNTRRSYRSSLRSFYGWMLATGRIAESPAHQLPPVKIPRAKPRPTPEVIYRVALATEEPRARLGIMLAGMCGMRRGEIARAKREDMEPDLLGQTLRVLGKGGHVRLVPLPDVLVAEIERRPAGWLFPSRQGGHLTPHYLAKIITRELDSGHTTHTLRHRAATVAYAATRDLRAVQELLGHAKPETTAIYTAVPDDAVRAAMMAAAA